MNYIFSYDSTTGVFTVPSGGDGVYYFSVFLLVPYGEYVNIDMTLNDDVICSIQADQNNSGSGDCQAASCSVVLDVVSGKRSFFISYIPLKFK